VGGAAERRRRAWDCPSVAGRRRGGAATTRGRSDPWDRAWRCEGDERRRWEPAVRWFDGRLNKSPYNFFLFSFSFFDQLLFFSNIF